MAKTEADSQPARVDISKKLVLVNSISSLVTLVLSMSVLIWLQQYLLGRITPEEYSLLPVLNSIMMFVPILTMVVTGGLGRYVVEAYARNDDERVTQIVSTMVPILCAVGLIFLVGGGVIAWNIGKILNVAPHLLWDARIMMALLMFSAAIRLPLSAFTVGFFVRQKFLLLDLVHVGVELFRLSLLFALLFGVSTRVLWVITASVCAEMLGQIIMVIMSRRLVPMLHFRPSHIHWPIASELTGFGGWTVVGRVSVSLREAADPIILNRLATAHDVTCSYLGSLVPRHLYNILFKVIFTLQPSLTAMHALKDSTKLANTYLTVGRYGLWVSMAVALPCMVYHAELAALYVGPAYADAGVVLLLLLVFFPLTYGNILAPRLANATGRIRGYNAISAVREAVNVALTLVLVGVYQMGAIGAAISTAIVLALFQPTFILRIGLDLSGVDLRTWLIKTLLPGLLPGVFALCLWLTLKGIQPPQSWTSMLIHIGAGQALYWTALLCLSLQPYDRALLKGTTNKLRRAFISRDPPVQLG